MDIMEMDDEYNDTNFDHTYMCVWYYLYTSLGMVKWLVVIYVKLLSHHIWELVLHTHKQKHLRPILYSNMCWN